jgi:hypothetical protein
MPRPRRDGQPTRPVNKRVLDSLFLKNLKPEEHTFLVWDEQQQGLVLQVRPTGHTSWKVLYSSQGKLRWYHLDSGKGIGLKEARAAALQIRAQVALGKDPHAECMAKRNEERKAKRSSIRFEELARRYVERHAKKKNKSWQQADALVKKHLIPAWGNLKPVEITRSVVTSTIANIESPSVANQTLAAASAIFSWAITQEDGRGRNQPM